MKSRTALGGLAPRLPRPPVHRALLARLARPAPGPAASVGPAPPEPAAAAAAVIALGLAGVRVQTREPVGRGLCPAGALGLAAAAPAPRAPRLRGPEGHRVRVDLGSGEGLESGGVHLLILGPGGPAGHGLPAVLPVARGTASTPATIPRTLVPAAPPVVRPVA